MSDLSAVKAGDEVALIEGHFHADPEFASRVKVERVTKMQVILEGGRRFTRHGAEIGETSSWNWYRAILMPMTPELEQRVLQDVGRKAAWERLQRAKDLIYQARINGLSDDKLLRIAAILEES